MSLRVSTLEFDLVPVANLHTHTLTVTHTLSHTHSHTHTHTRTHTVTHTHACIHTHMLTHSHTQTQKWTRPSPSYWWWYPVQRTQALIRFWGLTWELLHYSRARYGGCVCMLAVKSHTHIPNDKVRTCHYALLRSSSTCNIGLNYHILAGL